MRSLVGIDTPVSLPIDRHVAPVAHFRTVTHQRLGDSFERDADGTAVPAGQSQPLENSDHCVLLEGILVHVCQKPSAPLDLVVPEGALALFAGGRPSLVLPPGGVIHVRWHPADLSPADRATWLAHSTLLVSGI